MTTPTRVISLKYPCLALLAVLWVLPVMYSAAEVKQDAGIATPRFSCAGRTSGYYADVQTGCQKYHMCDSAGRLYSYSCPNQTLFQQRVMICDHWFMVDCSLSENYFSSNLNIGVRGRPFLPGHEEGSRRTSNRRTPGTSPSYREATTPYPWRRVTSAGSRTVTSFIPGEPIVKQLAAVAKKSTEEKIAKSPVTKKDNNKYLTPTVEVKQERTLPKEYANNPFFRGLTVGTSEAPKIISSKGQFGVLTPPLRKDHTNVFDKITDGNSIYFTSTSTTVETTTVAASSLSTNHKFNTFSTPIQELRKPLANIQETTSTAFTAESPSTSGPSFVTPRGHLEYRDELSNSASGFTDRDSEPPSTVQYDERPHDRSLLDEDTNVHDELTSNTVELRIPDTRHMFYIADTPGREAEMLNSNNETVFTIALPAYRHHGAMRFKTSRNAKGRRDDCPQCHPAFLLPGQCQPCVLIRR